jgi:hypothetical protein
VILDAGISAVEPEAEPSAPAHVPFDERRCPPSPG